MEILENTRLTQGYQEDIKVCNGSKLIFFGAVLGDIRITDKCTGIINGDVMGDVIVMPGGRAEINGTVHRTVFNYQGEVSVYGRINRLVNVRGNSFIDKKAVVVTVPCEVGAAGGHG